MKTSRNELAFFFAMVVAPFYARANSIGADELEKTTLAAIFAPFLLVGYRKIVPILRRKLAKVIGIEDIWQEVEIVEANLSLEDKERVHSSSYWRGVADGIKQERFAEQTAKGD